MFALSPTVEHDRNACRLTLDFSEVGQETSEKDAKGYAYFTAVFDSLQKAIGLDSRPR